MPSSLPQLILHITSLVSAVGFLSGKTMRLRHFRMLRIECWNELCAIKLFCVRQYWCWGKTATSKDASPRKVCPNRMHIVCMDRLQYPQREGVFDFESDLPEIKAQIEHRALDGLMRNESVARYIEWMREHREVFEFVDSIRQYDSGWWLGK